MLQPPTADAALPQTRAPTDDRPTLGIRGRTLAVLALLLVVGVGGALEVSRRRLEDQLERSTRADLQRTAGLLGLAPSPSPALVERAADFLDAHLIVLARDGQVEATDLPPERLQAVLVDYARDPGRRPLVERRLGGADWTLGHSPLLGGGELLLLRPGFQLSAGRGRIRRDLAGVGLLALMLALVAGSRLSASIVRPVETLAKAARRLASGAPEVTFETTRSDEIGELARALRTMIDQRDAALARLARHERLAAMGRLVGALAHELRNPLGALGMLLELELEQTEAGRTRETLERALVELRRLRQSTVKLLTFARGPDIHPAPCGLRELVEDSVSLLLRQLEHHGITLEVEGAAELEAEVDAEALRHVIVNLVQNALEASSRGSTIQVQVEVDDEQARIRVLDRGQGLPAQREDLFEPFASRREGGTGLGLAISRAIVAAHGGTMSAEDREGGGAIVSLSVPRSRS